MFRVDECRGAAEFLSFRDRVQGEGCFTTRFRSKDLDDASAGEPTDAESGIDRDGAGRDCLERRSAVDATEAHDGTFTKLFFYLRQSQIQSACLFVSLFCHKLFLLSRLRLIGPALAADLEL